MQLYNKIFYEDRAKGARSSAEEIIPIILNLVEPKSVIDVGCGTGTWLSVIKDHGINDILGIDGSYLDIHHLEIPKDNFLSLDLNDPIKIDRKFDLVISVEVAEHLPIENANIFIDSLIQLGQIILFSAAIPF